MSTISVVTVVKDDPAGFRRTLDSLVAQDSLADIEFVVVDSSVSPEPIRAMLDSLPRGLVSDYEYQPPRGIYAAMNSALTRATGDYSYFLNAGDELFDSAVLRRVHEVLADGPVWAFGPVEVLERGGKAVVTPPWDYQAEKALSFSRGLFPPHQGTFVRTSELLRIGGFDASFRIAADYAAFLHLSLVADPVALPFVIARFHEGGESTRNWQDSFREFHRARVEILAPSGVAGLRERAETYRHFGLVYAHREIRPRLSWRPTWMR